jgi:tetrahydromethanopterin S-methyltransferase subunit G
MSNEKKCVKDVVFIPCMICDKEFDRMIGTDPNWSSKSSIENYPDLCEPCYRTFNVRQACSSIMILINIMYKKFNDKQSLNIQADQLKEIADAINARIDLKTNNKYKRLEDKIKKNIKSINSINKKFDEVDNKLDDHIDPDIYKVIDKNILILDEKISKYECDIEDSIEGINQSKEFIEKYDTLLKNYENNKLKHSQLTQLKDTTPVKDLVHLYKSLHELECKIEFVNNNNTRYLEQSRNIAITYNDIENFKSEIKKCQLKNTKLKYFSSDEFCEKNIIEL